MDVCMDRAAARVWWHSSVATCPAPFDPESVGKPGGRGDRSAVLDSWRARRVPGRGRDPYKGSSGAAWVVFPYDAARGRSMARETGKTAGLPFYLDFVSPYTWMALMQAERFAREACISWEPRPVVYAALLSAHGL